MLGRRRIKTASQPEPSMGDLGRYPPVHTVGRRRAGIGNHTAYGTSKGAVSLFPMHLAAELGPDNIRVNAVCPTYVKTGMVESATRVTGISAQEFGRRVPTLGSLAEPEDVANMIVFLAWRPPHCEKQWAMLTEIGVEGGIERDVAPIIKDQVQLDFLCPRPCHIGDVELIAVRRQQAWVGPGAILPVSDRVRRKQSAAKLAVDCVGL